MSKLFKVLKVALAITFVVVLVGVHRPVSAQALGGGPTRAPSFADTVIPDAVTKPHALKGTYINEGGYEATAPVGVFTPIDKQLTVKCPVGPCSINADLLLEVGEGNAGGILDQFCAYVDGVSTYACEWLADITPPDGHWANIVQHGVIHDLTTGNHTVQLYFYTSGNTYVAHYQAVYTLYEP